MSPSTHRTDFFIVGNSKSGTTALYKFLDQHPSVCMSTPKEPNYFAADLVHDHGVGAFQRRPPDDYVACFDEARPGQLRGDASACYLYSTVAAQRIAIHNPEARILIMLREPVDFLHSYHLQMLKNPVSEGETVRAFAEALALEPARKEGRHLPDGCCVPSLLYYMDRVRYAEQVERYLSRFPRDQVFVIIYDDFRADNRAIVRDVLRFLHVDAAFTPTMKTHNASEKLRSKTLQRLMHDLTHGKGRFAGVQPMLKRVVPRRLRKALTQRVFRTLIFQPKPAVDSNLRRALMKQCAPEVEAISQLLGRDLVHLWGYDAVASPDASIAAPPHSSRDVPTRLQVR